MDDDYEQAIENDFLMTPKIPKNIIKAMCDVARIAYPDNEKDIYFMNLSDRMVELTLVGEKFLCTKVEQVIQIN